MVSQLRLKFREISKISFLSQIGHFFSENSKNDNNDSFLGFKEFILYMILTVFHVNSYNPIDQEIHPC